MIVKLITMTDKTMSTMTKALVLTKTALAMTTKVPQYHAKRSFNLPFDVNLVFCCYLPQRFIMNCNREPFLQEFGLKSVKLGI